MRPRTACAVRTRSPAGEPLPHDISPATCKTNHEQRQCSIFCLPEPFDELPNRNNVADVTVGLCNSICACNIMRHPPCSIQKTAWPAISQAPKLCLLPCRDISGGTFKVKQVARLFRQSFEALSQAAASPMQAGRALDVLFDTQAARGRGAVQQLLSTGVGFKRAREMGWTQQQHGQQHRAGGTAGLLPLNPPH